jgi:predicted nucleic acid-binding protein
MKALFDTNILIDYLNGIKQSKVEYNRFNEKWISIISYMEVLIGITDEALVGDVKIFLSTFQMVEIDLTIAELAIEIRKKYKLKIPDALILASAEKMGCLLLTRDKKDFPKNLPIVRIPYQV